MCSSSRKKRCEGGKIHLIVGVDPGIKTAFAALDLNGRTVASGTLKEADPDRIVEEISKLGIPSVVASDVNPVPSFVQKIAARFNVRTFVPLRSMQEEEKKHISPMAENLHERDAIAAAVKCYRFYANRLRQIEIMDTGHDRDMLKHLVISGFSLRNAILKLEPRGREEHGTAKGPEAKKEREDLEIVRLAEENVNLRKAAESYERRINELEDEIRKMKGQRYAEIAKDSEVKRLRSELQRMSWKIARFGKKLSRL
ncbi:MAG: DUF460 domain-containing protein [Candidatus ainarchaeum sp.]|nr:DUF460 domain-containing protein [Candidatus ainarchaeum sp.]